MSLQVDIRKKLGSFQLDAQFQAEAESLALLGASGCGKSVTLRAVAGILKPDEGRIVLDGTVLFDSAAHINLPPQRRNIGYLFQQYALFPNMTVRQNIAVAARDKALRDSAAAEKLRQFHLEDAADKLPGELSGGQQQRAALARILVTNPRAILLDEPFSALDSYLKYQLETELSDTLSQFSGPVVWVSHDRGEVWRNCRRVCVMDGGKSAPVITMEALFHNPETESAARLSGCKNYAAAIPAGSDIRLPDWNLTLHCGRPVPPDTRVAGIRSHHLRPSDGTEENQIPCTVVRTIDDVFGVIILLRPENAVSDAPLLRMELSRELWQAWASARRITVSVSPQNILLLK